jgi:hypothetical protein
VIPTKRILDYLNEARGTALLEAQTGSTDAGGYALRLIRSFETWLKAEELREFDKDGNPVKKPVATAGAA